MQVLVIEDNAALSTALQRSLTRGGIHVHLCAQGPQAVATWQQLQPDVVVLDLTLPDIDGLDILQSARKSQLVTPVLILTARGTVGDRVLGLNAGADDYLPKPFDLDELEARIRALYRRHSNTSNATHKDIQIGGLRLDRESGVIYHRSEALDLTPRESALMAALMTRPSHAVSKEQLFEVVFPGEIEVQIEAIEVVVYRLRKKIGSTGVNLMTLRGLGYLLKAAP